MTPSINASVLRISDWFFVLRPTLLIPICTIFLIGYSKGDSVLDNLQWIVFVIGAMCAGGAVYVINTIFDIQSDEKNDKNLFVVKNIFTVKTLKIYSILLTSIGLLLLLWTFRSHFYAVITGFLITGILYNVPPFRLKDRIGTDISAALLGGGLTYWCGFQLSNAPDVEMISIIPYLFAFTGVSVWTQIPDIQGDKEVNKQTFAVHFGEMIAARVGWFFVLTASITSLVLQDWSMVVSSITTLLVSVKLLWKRESNWAGFSARTAIFILTLLVALQCKVYLFALIFFYFVARVYYKKRFRLNYPSLTGNRW